MKHAASLVLRSLGSTRTSAWLVVVVWMVAMGRVAEADGVVIESFTGTRPADATRVLAPLHEELDARGYLTRERLQRTFEANVSRPAQTGEGLPPDFGERVERGHKAWISGRFDDAVATLVPTIELARANAGAFAQNQPLREKLLKALIALALSQQRKGDLADAKSTLAEVLRSFPEASVSRAQYGPDAYALFESVRQAAGSGGRGRLVVKTPTESEVVFVNERFENVGTVTKPDLIPGAYRVYVQAAKQTSRVHRIVIERDRETVLAIDPKLDATLRTEPSWTGFLWASPAEREQHEARFAVNIAQAAKATSVVVVGFDLVRGRPSLTGVLVDLQTAREIRRASLALEPEPTMERVRSLGRFLAGDAASPDLEVAVSEAPALSSAPGTAVPRSPVRWKKWTGIAALALGVGGASFAVKFGLDARTAGNDLERVCSVSCTSAEAMELTRVQDHARTRAIIAGSVGGALLVGGIVLLVSARSPSTASHVTVTVAPREASIGYSGSF
ncbi:MAG: hypothetical protein SFX73_10470 [Kofleriaceae bacterium]|nr:hypothetical protein [Kofleriaceae bacterium]